MAANELIAIELQLKGYEGVMSDFRTLDQMLNGFRGRRNKIEIEADLSRAKKEIIALEGELNKLNSIKLNLSEHGKQSEGLNNKIKETRERLREARQAVKEFNYALKELSSASFQQVFNKISSAVAHIGSAFQSAGNALTRLTNPFATFTKGIVMGAGYNALNKFTDGLTSAFDRVDVMRKYPRVMEQLGYSAADAQASIDKLDASVQGLPTGLDEIVSVAQRFTATVGDMNKGTDLAIASNNAFLASMSTETQRYQGMMQLQDVVGGKKMSSREWYSLANSMMPAIRMMGEYLGYTGKDLDEYVAKVQQGKIANEEFIDTLIKAGTSDEGKIRKVAMEAMDTWEAFFSRIRTAASRLGAGIITTLNSIVESYTGGKIKSVNMLLDKTFIPAIDRMTESAKKWIKAHPEEIADFFKSLKSINWGSIIRGVAEGFQGLAQLTKSFADMFGGKDLSWLGKFMVYGNVAGNTLTILGGLLKGSRHLIGGIGASGFKIFDSIKGIKKDGFMKWFTSQIVGKNPKATEEAVETMANTAPKMGKFMTGLSKVFTGWAEIATMVGGTALVGFGTFKAFKSMFKDLKEISELTKEIDWDVAAADLVAMAGFITAFIAVGTKVGQALGKEGLIGGGIFAGLTMMFAGTFWADMAMIKRGFKAISDAVKYIKEAEDTISELNSISNVPQMKKNVQQAAAVFNSLTDILQIERNNPITGESTNGLKELDKASADTVKNISDAIKNIKTTVDTLNELSGTKMQLGGLAAVIAGTRNAFNQLGNLLTEMPSVFKDATASSWANTMNGTMTNLKSVFDNLVGENGILASLSKLIQQMAELTKGNVFTDLKPRMEQLGEALTSVYTSLQGIGAGKYFATNVDNFRAGLKSLKFAIKHLQEIGGMEINNDIVGKVQGIIDNIQAAFDQGKIATLRETITTFKQSIEDALKSFEEINGDIEVDVNFKLGKGFATSRDKVIKQIKDAKDKIKNQKKAININIPVHVTFSVSTNLGAALGKIKSAFTKITDAQRGRRTITTHDSTGGQIFRTGTLYRSGGGFTPRGTDKVPAMLTPGEYVHKKQAVDFFGTDFMRKVNNLDVRGAMQELLTKAGTSVGVGRQSIVNNTVNNNQRITQNINTNNPSFANARMGRFVGAL